MVHFCAKVPSVTIERHMDLSRLVAARKKCIPPPTWSAIFTKAYALIAARNPVLRMSYLAFPWHRFYEHYTNIATLNIDRQLADERIVLYAHIISPETRTLRDLDVIIHDHQQKPVDQIPTYRRAVRMSRIPWPFRRLVWWAALNISGPVCSRFFGTIGFTSIGSEGAGITHVVPLLTTQLHYGMFDPASGLQMRLSFDHRVLDGVTAARRLAELEQVLLREILQECMESQGNSALANPDDLSSGC